MGLLYLFSLTFVCILILSSSTGHPTNTWDTPAIAPAKNILDGENC